MRDHLSVAAWRASTLALAVGWGLISCGGGGDGSVPSPPAVRSTDAPTVTALPATHAPATAPCQSPMATPPAPASSDALAAFRQAFDDELRAFAQQAPAAGAGVVELPDPFEQARP
jgi:hypothetical protein